MEQLKFANINSGIDIGFWQVLAKKKLEEIKLDSEPISIYGYYSPSGHEHMAPLLRIVPEVLLGMPSGLPLSAVKVPGELLIYNTIEDFKNSDKKAILDQLGKKIWEKGNLNTFALLVYADLKSYVFYYWVCFPIVNFAPVKARKIPITEVFEEEELKKALVRILKEQKGVFGIQKTEEVVITQEWADKEIIGYIDPASHPQVPSSPLRNILALLSKTRQGTVLVLSVKDPISSNPKNFQLKHSCVFEVEIPSITQESYLGWELNSKGKPAPRQVDLRPQLDPVLLAQSAVDLNLQLMRWRMVPDLDLQAIMQSSCLLLGSGTLGCQVARNLVAWGIKKITFVDNGKVSYSNPARQSLYEFEDAREAKFKALAAAEKIRKIAPGVETEGYVLEIPMPGHPITNADNVRSAYHELVSLVESHSVVFLLADTREARWLPSLICAAQDKTCISVGLGFDSFLVLRHGGSPYETTPERLGCYFCNDIVGPRNSTLDRTLDQQCTVTRPGLSYQASATAVELLVTFLHHPLTHKAPHLAQTPLGCAPHQIRGGFGSFSVMTYSGAAFSKCTACSERVVDRYLGEGFEFLKEACGSPEFLEKVCELDTLDQVDEDELIEIEDFE